MNISLKLLLAAVAGMIISNPVLAANGNSMSETRVKQLIVSEIQTNPDAKGATGATGATGPAGPAGGLTLTDASSASLGTITQITPFGATYQLLTSTNHIVSLTLDGTFPDTEWIYYSNTDCTGSANVKADSVGLAYDGKAVIASNNTLYTFTTTNTNGISESQAGINSGSHWNNTFGCLLYSTIINGWPLTETSNTSIGLPATIALPLAITR